MSLMAFHSSWPAACALGVTLLAGSAQAYCRTTTSAMQASSCTSTNECVFDGIPLAWSVSDIEFVINERGFPGFDDTTLRAVLEASFDAWEKVSCDGQPVAIAVGAAPGFTDLTVGPEELEPNESVVSLLFGEEWRSLGYDSAAFALTSIWYGPDDGIIYGADMHFNGGMEGFGVCPDVGCRDGTIDLRNVATHEAGHFLGLAHSAAPEATMWCDAQAGEVSKRTLSLDDAEGLCAIYPPGFDFVNDGVGQYGLFQRNQSSSGSRGACALRAGTAGSSVWALWASLLGGLAWITRRARR